MEYNRLVSMFKNKQISFFNTWRLNRIIRKLKKNQEILDFKSALDKCVKGLCGPKWNSVVSVYHIDEFEQHEEQSGTEKSAENRQGDK